MGSTLQTYILPLLPVLFIVFPPSASLGADSPAEQLSTIERLERKLELGMQEQLAAIKSDPDSILSDFSTDGCSGGLSIGWNFLAETVEHIQSVHGAQPPWESCCVTHDKRYHVAGDREASAEEGFAMRKEADRELKTCVLLTGMDRTSELSRAYGLSAREVELLYRGIAEMMYHAVRIGGIPCSGLPWRWGYGWPECE